MVDCLILSTPQGNGARVYFGQKAKKWHEIAKVRKKPRRKILFFGKVDTVYGLPEVIPSQIEIEKEVKENE